MKNFIQRGDVITVAAPTGGVSSGDAVLIGTLFGVAATDAVVGAEVEIATVGVFDLPKAAETLAPGAALYWDTTNSNLTATAEDNELVGVAVAAAASGGALASIRLNGAFGVPIVNLV